MAFTIMAARLQDDFRARFTNDPGDLPRLMLDDTALTFALAPKDDLEVSADEVRRARQLADAATAFADELERLRDEAASSEDEPDAA
ncbi:hypothetical protein HNR23_004761 [Nocardiopsis mwathae]|uniref:Uncharacterized protein n=1 Tax=Nocardiopsis mwathae TaxID=1472723 RepID=A0A7W9YP82_9ACTN|nr:hypothetical protein [Nocardiopsis mwathae]MBB6174701.1 hypothetical protein [Nocardiopsis mwathae]